MADDEDRLKKEEERLLRAMTLKDRKPFKPATSTVPVTKPATPSTVAAPVRAPSRPAAVVASTSNSASTAPPAAASTRAGAAPGLTRTGSKILTEDEIRAREADMERERERLRALEKNLVKNSYNALSQEGVTADEAVVPEVYRGAAAATAKSSTPSAISTPPPVAPTPSTAVQTSSRSAADAKKPLDDIESLLAQLDVAASSSSKPKLATERPAPQRPSAADLARTVLATARSNVSSLLSASMARDPPSPHTLDDDMAVYIRHIVGQVKPVQERGARIASTQFEFEAFSRDVDQLARTVLNDLHYFLQQEDREQLAAHCDDLLQRAVAVIDAAASVISGAPQTAADIATKQNGFVAALQKLIEALTAAAKRQIEMSASMRDAAHNLAECVQETAVYAQQIAEQLKQPLLEIQAFKQSLTSMISAIKKAHQYIDSNDVKDAIMAHTRRVLEASLKLQSGDAEAATAHVDVLHEVTGLLKTLMALLRK